MNVKHDRKITIKAIFDRENEREEMSMNEQSYKYYSTQRPISIGTYPTKNNLDIKNYDTRTYINEINREAWGELTYSEPLTDNQLKEYELVADPNIKLRLEQRVSGDDLLNAQDLIDEVKRVGGIVDDYGNVTVYHRTDEKNAERIKNAKIMVAKEDGLFFSTKENGQNAGYGEAVIQLSIPIEKLTLDDIFSDEAHLKYPLENVRRLDISDYLVSDEVQREVTHVNHSEEKIDTLLLQKGNSSWRYAYNEKENNYDVKIIEIENGINKVTSTRTADEMRYEVEFLKNDGFEEITPKQYTVLENKENDTMYLYEYNTEKDEYNLTIKEGLNITNISRERELAEAEMEILKKQGLEEVEYNEETMKVAENQEIKNPYNESNFKIQSLENGQEFVVRSDSERFGENEIVYQSTNYEDCLNYIDERIDNIKPSYYVIKDLASWRSDVWENPPEQSTIERFDNVDEAIQKFKEYKNMDYLKEEKINPQTNEPMRRLVLGVSYAPKQARELDLLHTESDKTLILSDVIGERQDGYETFMTNSNFIKDLNKITSQIHIDEYTYYRDTTMEELANERLALLEKNYPEETHTWEEAMREAKYFVRLHPNYLTSTKVNERVDFKEFAPPFLNKEIEHEQIEEESQISFVVSECMEFNTLGMNYVDIPTIDEAINVYQNLPDSVRNMGNGISIVVNNEEIPIYDNGEIGTILEFYPQEIRDNIAVQNAIERLENVFKEKKNEPMEVAVESTKDYNNYYFQPNMNNTEGRGREDYFRVVYINDVGDIQPYTNDIYNSFEEALMQANNIGKVISYDELVDNTVEIRTTSEVQEKRKEFYAQYDKLENAMKQNGWENRLLEGEKSYWFKTDNATDKVEEIDFNNFEELENHINAEKILKNEELTDTIVKDWEEEYNIKVPEEQQMTILNLVNDTALSRNQIESYTYQILDDLEKNQKEFNTWLNHAENINTLEDIKNFETNFYIQVNEPYPNPNQYGRDLYSTLTEEQIEKINNVVAKKREEINTKEVNQKDERIENNKMEKQENSTHREEKKKSKKEIAIELKEETLANLRNGVEKTLNSEEFANWCQKQSQHYSRSKSFNNAMLIYLQKPEASYVMGREKWKEYGRTVNKDAKEIRILAPASYVQDLKGKGSLFNAIKSNCSNQFKKDKDLEYAKYDLAETNLSFEMYKNGLFDVKFKNEIFMAHVTEDEVKKYLDKNVIGKMPSFYKSVAVYDVSDTTDKEEFLWVSKDSCKREEMVLDDNGKPIVARNGKVKIYNSDERRNKFNLDFSMKLQEQDVEKMQVLYETLQNISKNKGIPMSEAEPSKDSELQSALGYYRRPTEEFPNGNIVIKSDLSITDKVAVAFHEMAHSDLHKDLEALKQKLKENGHNDISEITRNMREVQAEAVAYMSASTFGIETEHKSFQYIANWSDGRELKALEKSMEIIFSESKKLLQDIEKDLDTRGYNLALELKDKTPLNSEQVQSKVVVYKDFVLNNLRDNEVMLKSAFDELKNLTDGAQKEIVEEQVLLTRKVEDKLLLINKKIDSYEKSTDKQEQKKLETQMKSNKTQVENLQKKIDVLTEQRMELIKEEYRANKNDIKMIYETSPMKAIEKLKKEFPQMKSLSEVEMKYIASSKFIAKEYGNLIGKDNEKFVDLAMKQVENFQETISKNKTVVEVAFCENWSDKPIFEKGTLAHPKEANKIIANAEKEIKALKKEAEKNEEYYPYSKCKLSVYSITEKNKLSMLSTRIDIGDGSQKDLTSHLQQICENNKDTINLFANFEKSVRERTNIKLLTPYEQEQRNVEAKQEYEPNQDTLSMAEWQESLSGKTEREESEQEADNERE